MTPQECVEYYNNLIEILNTDDVSKFERTLDKSLKEGFPIDYNPQGRLTLLQYAIQYGPCKFDKIRSAIIRLLLDRGADVNVTNCLSLNILHYVAIFPVSMELFEDILNKTENVNLVGSGSYSYICTPLSTLCSEYIRYLPLQHEESEDCYKRIKLLLDRNADVDLAVKLLEKQIFERKKLKQKYSKKEKKYNISGLTLEELEDPCYMTKNERRRWEELKEYMYSYSLYRQGVEATQEYDIEMYER